MPEIGRRTRGPSTTSIGWLGMQSGSTLQTWLARGLTLFYFGFFVFMPFWSRLGATKPVPDRVTTHD